MERVTVDDVASDAAEAGVDRHRLAERLGATGLALTRYRVAPGESLPAGLHAHADQEEVFYVLDGTVAFETLPAVSDENDASDGNGASDGNDASDDDAEEDGHVVEAGGAIRFAPGEFQSGRNAGTSPLDVLAVGAPRDSIDLRFPTTCPDCGRGEMRLVTDDGGPQFVCPACETTRTPTACPDCGGDDLRFRRGEEVRTVVRCSDCETAFETPPVEGEW
ncbi:cupin [Halomarina salina]|uniref:Cupin n=1 Tax=Halomarina salina TaxID=1872699 RepID=A0ABD5RI06_9EURY|nr:cupin [Halomarina salina]